MSRVKMINSKANVEMNELFEYMVAGQKTKHAGAAKLPQKMSVLNIKRVPKWRK